MTTRAVSRDPHRGAAPLTRRIGTFALGSVLAGALVGASACGYAFVKKSELNRPPKVIVDSAQVLALRSQLADAESRRRADSVKCDAALQQATAKPAGVPDSVLKARDADIAALKDQLAKAQAELDRIKRRLATPRS